MNPDENLTVTLDKSADVSAISSWLRQNGMQEERTSQRYHGQLASWRYRLKDVEDKMLFAMRWV